MANYLTHISSLDELICSAEELKDIKQMLQESDNPEEIHGFELHSTPTEAGFYFSLNAQEQGDLNNLLLPLIELLGKLVAKNGREFLEFGISYTSQGAGISWSQGGGFARIYPDGSMKYSIERMFPE